MAHPVTSASHYRRPPYSTSIREAIPKIPGCMSWPLPTRRSSPVSSEAASLSCSLVPKMGCPSGKDIRMRGSLDGFWLETSCVVEFIAIVDTAAVSDGLEEPGVISTTWSVFSTDRACEGTRQRPSDLVFIVVANALYLKNSRGQPHHSNCVGRAGWCWQLVVSASCPPAGQPYCVFDVPGHS